MRVVTLNNFHTFTPMEEIWKVVPDFEASQAYQNKLKEITNE